METTPLEFSRLFPVGEEYRVLRARREAGGHGEVRTVPGGDGEDKGIGLGSYLPVPPVLLMHQSGCSTASLPRAARAGDRVTLIELD